MKASKEHLEEGPMGKQTLGGGGLGTVHPGRKRQENHFSFEIYTVVKYLVLKLYEK